MTSLHGDVEHLHADDVTVVLKQPQQRRHYLHFLHPKLQFLRNDLTFYCGIFCDSRIQGLSSLIVQIL